MEVFDAVLPDIRRVRTAVENIVNVTFHCVEFEVRQLLDIFKLENVLTCNLQALQLQGALPQDLTAQVRTEYINYLLSRLDGIDFTTNP